MTKDRKLTDAFSHTAGVFIVLGILIAVNVLFGSLRLRADLTEDRIYTLSDGTRGLVRDLERTVVLKYYFSAGNPDLPVPIKQFGQRVNDLLREYASASRGRIRIERYDPQPDSDEEEWAQRYGLQGQSLDPLGFGPPVYMGLVAVAGAREAAIPFVSPGEEPRLEYAITRLISEVVQERKPKLGVMSPLPVLGQPRGPMMQEPQGWLFIEELKRQYEVQLLTPPFNAVPDDIDLVVAIHPKDLPDATLFALDQFILRGGRLLAFVDPLCLTEQQRMDQPMQPWAMPSFASDLNRLMQNWGVELAAGRVVADPAAASQVGFGPGGAEMMPTWLSLRGGAGIDKEQIVTSGLDALMFPFPGAFTGEAVEGLTQTVLVRASEDASLLPASLATQPGPEKMRSAMPEPGASLALRLQGRFPTAFPDGAPRAAPEEGEEDPAPPADFLREAEAEGVVVLVADVDIIFDEYAVRRGNFMGQIVYQPINNNLDFAINLVEELAGSDALIGLRSRGRVDRPFHRVLALAARAQARGQQEELRLQSRLQELQIRLSELQTGKQEDQQFILSPEQQHEIERFSQERFETQRQLREVRKNLRRDINRLGALLKSINLLAMPIAVATFGLGYWWKRRQRGA